MKTNQKLTVFLFLGLMLLFAPRLTNAQNEDNVFVIFETTVTKAGVETSDEHPSERRFYVSNVVTIRSNDPSVSRNSMKTADKYFIAAVVDPLKSAGILHQYYDDGIRINNNVVYKMETKAEVDELHDKVLGELKDRGANVFTFTWDFENKNPSGLDAANPVLYYRAPGAPLYETGKKAVPPATPAKTPVKKPAKKPSRN